MRTIRPAIALDPRRFGRALPRSTPAPELSAKMSEDMRLFATTFAVGFLFVSVLIA